MRRAPAANESFWSTALDDEIAAFVNLDLEEEEEEVRVHLLASGHDDNEISSGSMGDLPPIEVSSIWLEMCRVGLSALCGGAAHSRSAHHNCGRETFVAVAVAVVQMLLGAFLLTTFILYSTARCPLLLWGPYVVVMGVAILLINTLTLITIAGKTSWLYGKTIDAIEELLCLVGSSSAKHAEDLLDPTTAHRKCLLFVAIPLTALLLCLPLALGIIAWLIYGFVLTFAFPRRDACFGGFFASTLIALIAFWSLCAGRCAYGAVYRVRSDLTIRIPRAGCARK